jgi:hypothetical protein
MLSGPKETRSSTRAGGKGGNMEDKIYCGYTNKYVTKAYCQFTEDFICQGCPRKTRISKT